MINNKLAFEPWKYATLLEGWTGSIKYSKNGLGQVRLSMSVGTGSKISDGTTIATLPHGYIPNEVVLVPIVKGNGTTWGVGVKL